MTQIHEPRADASSETEFPAGRAVAPRKRTIALVLVLAAVALVCGWRLFWFLTDDAFIAFRYASNSRSGYGYVWNPPPFRPVEGYTSFLWVVLLGATWRLFGVEPPQAASWLSLAFAFGTLLLTAAMALKIRLRPSLESKRILFLILVLLGVLGNRTFLAWTSSGLETAMFNFLVLAWAYCCLFLSPGHARRLVGVSASAALIYLSRPDGILFVLATAAPIAVECGRGIRNRKLSARRVAAILPLAIVPLHLLWRKKVYGEWLPNTYYAKVVAAWPQSGWRYCLSFLLEYGFWLWVVVALWWMVAAVRRIAQRETAPLRAASPRSLCAALLAEPRRLAAFAVVAVLSAHFAYYTLYVGGDHFEYRVYSHLIPILFLSFVWLEDRLEFTARKAVLVLACLLGLGYPIPWTHWALTRHRNTREETFMMRVPLAGHFPLPVRPYVAAFDRLQDWLIGHLVCCRHQEHKVFWQLQAQCLPARAEGSKMRFGEFPVVAYGSVGVLGWVLPQANVIDGGGLNDHVIARTPPSPDGPRLMAHERRTTPEYIQSFLPDVFFVSGKGIEYHPRKGPLTAQKIVEIENRYWR